MVPHACRLLYVPALLYPPGYAACWISVQPFLHSIRLSVDIPNLYCPTPLHEQHDCAIMSLPRHGFSDKEMLLINRCRIYLQVHMVSKISTARGNHLCHDAWQGVQISAHTTLRLWPRQHRPNSPAYWQAWQRDLWDNSYRRDIITSTPITCRSLFHWANG